MAHHATRRPRAAAAPLRSSRIGPASLVVAALAALAGCATTAPSESAKTRGEEASYSLGVGAVPCSVYLQTIGGSANGPGSRELFKETFNQWVFGFVSALNVEEETNLPLFAVRPETVEDVVENYCQANKDRRVVDAGVEMFNALRHLQGDSETSAKN